ncbi:MAG TPA: hypothetical protein VF592_03460 [Sphingomonas sp.]|jgi:hypothetical protein|uniref:hypothetical protein n=1 Tax=Sphingomonas sp. TaxID=28214 RepID=UPI002EDB1143
MTNQPISREEVARLRELLAAHEAWPADRGPPAWAWARGWTTFHTANRARQALLARLPALLDAADRLAAPTDAGEASERVREALSDLLPAPLCGEAWDLPDSNTVAITITFGKLRAARAALKGPTHG